jgi:iron complex outermembrane receptor protein
MKKFITIVFFSMHYIRGLLFLLLFVGMGSGEVLGEPKNGVNHRIILLEASPPFEVLPVLRQEIQGTVRDENGEPMIGVSILEKGTGNGTVTDLDGSYSLVVKDASSVLVFSYVGYQRQEITANNQSEINVSMVPDNTLEQVVITALGIERDKKDLGYSVSEVRGQELAQTSELSPVNALQGRVAGVQIDQGGGGAFGTSKILIRGNSTLSNNNQPIFVIDGVIIENDIFGGTGRDFWMLSETDGDPIAM